MAKDSSKRQIPSNGIIVQKKDYSDLLYGWIQSESEFDPINCKRYIVKSKINYTNIAKILNISRQTASKKFNYLIDSGLLVYNIEYDGYEIITLSQELAALMPARTVRVLCNTLQERSLSILAYLIKTFIQHGSNPCEINLCVIRDYLGLKTGKNDRKNNYLITDVFLLLQKLGLIQFHTEKTKDKKTESVKMCYILDIVNPNLDFECDFDNENY